MLLKWFINHQWKQAKRSPIFQKNLIVNIFLGFIVLLLFLEFLVGAWTYDREFDNGNSGIGTVNFIKNNAPKLGKRKVAFVTSTPNQVVTTTIYKTMLTDFEQQVVVFSTIDTALNWLTSNPLNTKELIDLVIKNLDKNPSYYVEEAQFGVKGIGYTEDYPGLGKGKMVKDAGKGGGYGEATKKDFPKGEVGTGYLAEGKKPGYIAKLAEIDKQSKVVALEAKIEALAEIISTKETRISMISEDEDLAELMDKGKIKEIQKEIKILMKEKAKMEKLYEKMRGKKKEVMEEDTEVQEDLGSDDVVDLNVDNPARDAEIGMNLPQ